MRIGVKGVSGRGGSIGGGARTFLLELGVPRERLDWGAVVVDWEELDVFVGLTRAAQVTAWPSSGLAAHDRSEYDLWQLTVVECEELPTRLLRRNEEQVRLYEVRREKWGRLGLEVCAQPVLTCT